MKKKGKIFIGTSGWSYKHWKGIFYPSDLKEAAQFGFYVKKLNSVEINSSFYHLPNVKNFKKWKQNSPSKFTFSVKASRYITHMKKLITEENELENFLMLTKNLDKKLGPILFQLPPNWKLNIGRLEDFLEKLPRKSQFKFTFEFRNHTWFVSEVYALLKKYNCALCIYHLENFMAPLEVTADFVYIRLHGPGNKYQGNYSLAALKKWSKNCQTWMDEGKDVYIYFDNDQNGYAVFNAQKLSDLCKKN